MKQNILLIIFLIVVITFWIISFKELNKTYSLYLIELSNIDQIKLKSNDTIKLITNKNDIETIYYILKNRTTKIESIQDSPSENNIELILEENITLFLYQKDNKFYIEQPYNGIYTISKKEYEIIKKYIA